MPTLDWIGKQAVVNHDKDVPFRLLKRDPKLSVGDSQNLIIKGDNLEALKALMPYYVGKVKCIYIDPPYNTGNEGWIYNDAVKSPEIQKWLGKVVGNQGEDLTMHDKWLCMMYPRIIMLRELLTRDGAIFVSIDDTEQHRLRMMMDAIFGSHNFVTNIIWQKKYTQSNDAKFFSDTHDFIICYAKEIANFRIKKLPRTEEQKARYKNPDNDPRGPWKPIPLHAKSGTARKECCFLNGNKWIPPPGTFNRYSDSTLQKADKDNRIYFGKNGKSTPSMKRFLSEMSDGVIPKTMWLHDEAGHNDEAKRELKAIFPSNPFSTPKPTRLIKRILRVTSDPKDNDIILDSFAGSGTTAHAVLDLNKEDGGRRQFIMVEMENDIANKIIAKRIKKVINGYKKKKGLSDGFQFMNLDTTLFDADGNISDPVTYKDLARYVFFTETQKDLDEKKIKKPFIGADGDTDYFLFFTEKGKNTVTRKEIAKLPKKGGKKVVYADRCLISEVNLKKENIVFKQIPYQVKVY